MKKNKGGNTAIAESTEVQGTSVEATATISEPKKLGRPVNPNSARQQKLAGATENNGKPKALGRPVVPGSKRQLKLATKGTGVAGKRGRPAMTEEQKIAAKQARAAKIAQWNAEHPEDQVVA